MLILLAKVDWLIILISVCCVVRPGKKDLDHVAADPEDRLIVLYFRV